MAPQLKRRDFIKISVAAVGGLAVLKVGGRLVLGVKDAPEPAAGPFDPSRLQHLSPRTEAVVVAAALAMVGFAAQKAFDEGRWDPAKAVDDFLGHMPEDQRSLFGVGLNLLEEWTLGLTGFSSRSLVDRQNILGRWRTSNMALKRTIWGTLHGFCCSSFSAIEPGWELMNYPGPCVGPESRQPGQSAFFDWDESVP